MTAAVLRQREGEGMAPLHPSDFNPPLRRSKPTVPGYWTADEIALEIGTGSQKVRRDITGRSDSNRKPCLTGYQAGNCWLVPEQEALLYILKRRKVSQEAA